MNMQDVITLVSGEITVDKYGIPQPEHETKDVYARVESVSAAEFFGGGQNGLKPELRFLVSAWDYSGEPVVRYQGRPYSVYRTFRRTVDLMELYAERRVGVGS